MAMTIGTDRRPRRAVPLFPIRFPAAQALALLLCTAATGLAQAPARTNLAMNKVCKASSVEGKLTPDKAVDGPKSQGSRWGSNYGTDKNKDSAWIFVDLGREYSVDSVAIYWEHSGAKRYDIQAWDKPADTPSYSDEGWKTLLTDTTLTYQPRPVDMCLSFLKLPPSPLRYLRVRCYKRMFEFGFSIMELEVYGKEGTASTLSRPIAAGSARPGGFNARMGFAWPAGSGNGRFFTADGRGPAAKTRP